MTGGRFPELLVLASMRRPWATILIASLLVALVGAWIPGLEVEASADSVLDRAGSEWGLYQDAQAVFGTDEVIVVSLKGLEPFDPSVMLRVRELGEGLAELDGIRRVDSIASLPVVRATDAGAVELTPATEGLALRSPDDASVVRSRLARDRLAERLTVAPDGRAFAVNLYLEENTEESYPELVEEIRHQCDGLDCSISGVPVVRVAASAETRSQLGRFAPAVGVALGALFLLWFRSALAAILPLAVGGGGAVVVLGALGIAGEPVTITTSILPPVILALGCAYSMHFLVSAARTQGEDDLARVLGRLAAPISLSGLTTSVGFLAVGAVRIDAIRSVGTFGALGVVAVTLLSLSICPAVISVSTARKGALRNRRQYLAKPMDRLVEWVVGGRAALMAGWSFLLLISLVGLSALEIDTDVTRWFAQGHPVRDDYDAIRSDLSGISPMNVVVRATSDEWVTNPAALEAIDGLSAFLNSRAEVGKVISIADPLRQIHGGFADDDKQPLPKDSDLIAQYLLLLDGMEQLDDLLASDHSQANVIIRVDNNGSASLLTLGEEAETWWAEYGPPGFEARSTGIMLQFAQSQDEIARGQLMGLLFAGGAIGLILAVMFRRPSMVLIALVANFAPVIVIFGAMGLLGFPLDAGTVLVGCFALGIAVDDTIHVLVAYQRSVLAGRSTRDSISAALREVLPAIGATTIIISGGFGVLISSSFVFTRNLGALTSASMFICLAADVTLLAALLQFFGKSLVTAAHRPAALD